MSPQERALEHLKDWKKGADGPQIRKHGRKDPGGESPSAAQKLARGLLSPHFEIAPNLSQVDPLRLEERAIREDCGLLETSLIKKVRIGQNRNTGQRRHFDVDRKQCVLDLHYDPS